MSKDKKKPKTFMGKLLRGIVGIGRTVSPKLMGLIDAVAGPEDLAPIEHQLAKEGYSDAELEYLLAEMDKDREEMKAITERWLSDNKDGSWMARNVRPYTCALYNVATIVFIGLDSYTKLAFEVPEMFITLLISNMGIVNTAYFGTRYLEKRDKIKN